MARAAGCYGCSSEIFGEGIEKSEVGEVWPWVGKAAFFSYTQRTSNSI